MDFAVDFPGEPGWVSSDRPVLDLTQSIISFSAAGLIIFEFVGFLVKFFSLWDPQGFYFSWAFPSRLVRPDCGR